MTVFKYFFKILKKYIFTIIMFTGILIIFGVFSLKTNNTSTNFTADKPNICIVNEDENIGVTKSLYEYLEKNSNIKQIENNDEAREDALFYRDVNYIIYIPQNYHNDYINNENPEIKVKSSGDYMASLAEILLNNFLQTANIYLEQGMNEQEIIENTNKALEQNTIVEMTSTINNEAIEQANFYYNFANYSILSICIYVVGMIMSSFKDKNIRKRTMISPVKNKNYNRSIFLGIIVLGIGLWLIYYLISIILIKDVMLSIYGVYYAINSFVFTICGLSIAFIIGNIISKKEAISGISNVIALGSSFLCGSFVPVQYLPDTVLKVAHILPSYWYIQNNEYIKTIEEFNFQTLTPFITNLGILALFIIGFLTINNIYSKRKLS